MSPKKRIVASIILTVCALASGYAFYKMNPHDVFSPLAFGFGLLGIMLSFLRNSKPSDSEK